MPVDIPANNAKPFAASGLKDAIPFTSSEHGKASMYSGFPAETMTSGINSVPPRGRDMNGILHQLSSHQVYLNAGGLYRFDANHATDIGGYAAGAVLLLDDGLSAVISLQDGNNNNPNDNMTGWAPYAGKLVTDAVADCSENKYDKTGGTISGNASVTGTLHAQRVTVGGGDTEMYADSAGSVERAVLATSRQQFYMNKPLYFGDYVADNQGYTTLPNGFIMQFGFIPYSSAAGNLDGSTTGEKVFNLTFPVPFTVDCFSLQTTLCIAELEVGNDTWLQVYGVSNTGATLLNQTANAQSGSQQPFLGIYWQAIGR